MSDYLKEPEDGKVTPEGEISWFPEEGLYKVSDETWSDYIYVGPDFDAAIAAFEDYCKTLDFVP